MKKRISFIMLFAGILCGYILPLHAQCPAENNAFKCGEKLTYELFFNWKFIWVKAGEANMRTKSIVHNSCPAFHTLLTVTSNKRADKFFKMRDTLTSIITEKMEPVYFRKGAEEGKRYTVDEAWFSYPNGESHIKQRKKRHNGEIINTQQTETECVYDMLSILSQARSFDTNNYKKGEKIKFLMATGRKVEEQTLIFRGKKNFKAEDDDSTTYRCLVFSLVEYTEKGKEKEVITFYITDDKNHLPVRLDLFLNFGSGKAFLKNVEGNRHPLTSIVKTKKK